MRNLLLALMILGCHSALLASTPQDSVLKTIKVKEYTVRLERVYQVETTEVKPPWRDNHPPYADLYVIYTADNMIASVPYKKDMCELLFVERDRIQGAYRVTNRVTLNICNRTVQKEAPPSIDWLKHAIDSITIRPLDTILPDQFGTYNTVSIPKQYLQNPVRLEDQIVSNILFHYPNARPIDYIEELDTMFRHFHMVIYEQGNTHEWYLYYDKFYMDGWWFTLDWAMHWTENVAMKWWKEQMKVQESETGRD